MNLDTLFDASAAARNKAEGITIRRPDDWHVHLRDGAMLRAVLPFTAGQFARGIIMPNLVPPVTTVDAAAAYRDRILAARPTGSDFEPLMTCYLTDTTSPDEIEKGYSEKVWVAAKLYPRWRHHQCASRRDRYQGTASGARADGADRHARADPRRGDRSGRRCVRSRSRVHGAEPVAAVAGSSRPEGGHRACHDQGNGRDRPRARRRVAGTVTPHHLVINRTSLFQGGLRPHLYCLPVAKREHHRLALRQAVTSGDSCFFIGTDTAPHLASAKEAACGCAGVFVGATALQTYVQVFDEEGALDRLEAFASLNGANFYGLPVNKGTIELKRRAASMPAAVSVDDGDIVIFRGAEEMPWSVGEVRR